MEPGSQVDFFLHVHTDGRNATVSGKILWCAGGCLEVLAWFPGQCAPLVIECCPSMTAPEYITAMITTTLQATANSPGD